MPTLLIFFKNEIPYLHQKIFFFCLSPVSMNGTLFFKNPVLKHKFDFSKNPSDWDRHRNAKVHLMRENKQILG